MVGKMLARPTQELINMVFGDTGVDAIYKDLNTGELEVVELATVEES